jgi:hypothetical protein
MKRFIEFSFDHMVAHQHFVALLGDENTHKARHVKQSGQLIDMHDRLEKTIGGMLARGRESVVFKRDVDPVELYISIASLCFFTSPTGTPCRRSSTATSQARKSLPADAPMWSTS